MPTASTSCRSGVVGVAVGVVLLPELARALKCGHLAEAGNLQNRSIEFVLFLTLPAAVALWILSDEIIRVLYERGAFHQENTALVGSILAIYGLGLPAFVLIKALQPGFYAREDTQVRRCGFRRSPSPSTARLRLASSRILARAASRWPRRRAGWISTVLLFATLLRRGHLTWEWALARRAVLVAGRLGDHGRGDHLSAAPLGAVARLWCVVAHQGRHLGLAHTSFRWPSILRPPS